MRREEKSSKALSSAESFTFVHYIIYISLLAYKNLGYTNYGSWFHTQVLPLTDSLLLGNCLNSFRRSILI